MLVGQERKNITIILKENEISNQSHSKDNKNEKLDSFWKNK